MGRCRCHSRKEAQRCCAPLHQGRAAATPLALMRSRFAAYALGDVAYIIATTVPGGPAWEADRARWEAEILRFSEANRFVGLRIVEAAPAGEERGWVHFIAELERGGQVAQLEERSEFHRVGERWLYWGGVS